MKLSQYERFFSKHFDGEVRERGLFLLGLIDHLEKELIVCEGWPSKKIPQCQTRMQEIHLRAIIYALDRHQGSKTEAAKWLGISRQMIYKAIYKWNKLQHENKTTDSDNHIPVRTHSLQNPTSRSRKRIGGTNHA